VGSAVTIEPSAAAASVFAREMAAELDEAVWRVLEHRQERVPLLLVESDGVEVTVDAPADRFRGRDRGRQTIGEQRRDEHPRVVGADRNPMQVQDRHATEDRAA